MSSWLSRRVVVVTCLVAACGGALFGCGPCSMLCAAEDIVSGVRVKCVVLVLVLATLSLHACCNTGIPIFTSMRNNYKMLMKLVSE